MTYYIKGKSVAYATSYRILEKKINGTYTSLAEVDSLNFDLSTLDLDPENTHTLVVQALNSAYADSEYSNEITYGGVSSAVLGVGVLGTMILGSS